ncbi:DNA packaging protein [Haematobacter massiliensis]|uniref:DNA packaging protein n=1 Tax=Haematobacter massiliensis TaxID=195105 RepID=A0A086Y0E8_9RHOB|nr:phage terminase large subunit [Haematobacter massiliensis]KFI27748.1 DNA packaging protein [Haematobacter massiliensis]OWJ82721.1 DNA-packaging protein [Haematobacter massiliensis]
MTQTFRLTDKQGELRNAAASAARHILAYGGSRSGKTFGFCYCIAIRALSAPDSRHLIARLHNIDVRQAVMMDTWPSVMRMAFPGVPYTVNRQDQFVRFDNGAEVWFGGLDDKERVEKILGKEYATVYVNEASQVAYETVLTLRTRLAQNVQKVNGRPLALKAYYDLNPTGRSHWTYREFVEGVRPDNRMPFPPGSRTWVQLNPTSNPHLPDAYLEELAQMPERHRQRFLEGKYLSEVPGTLWPVDRIDACRVDAAPQLTRIVVAIDPSGSDGAGGDSQGIVVVGKGIDGHAYLIEDATCRLSPAGWGARAVEMYHKHGADLIIAEGNYGGAMVESTIRTADPRAKVKLVNASRGKHVRAEPVAALYEARENKPAVAHHVGAFPELEDQMAAFTTSGWQGSGSPDRADALVWALTELMLADQGEAAVLLRKRHR